MSTLETTVAAPAHVADGSNGKPKTKKATKKPAKKAAKKAAAKKAPVKRGDTVRLRVFKLLAKGKFTGKQVMEKLSLTGIPSLLKDEAVCKPPRITRDYSPRESGAQGPAEYTLTAAGRKALEKGTVDSEAAPISAGK